MGLEVKMNEGESAMCCSVPVAENEGGGGSERCGRSSDDIDGDGEGGRVMVVCDDAFPFDLILLACISHFGSDLAYQFVPSLSIIFQSTPSFLMPDPTSSV